MISEVFNTLLYQPLYNGLVFLISVIPFGDVGFAVIVLTALVKFAILPLTHKGTKAQARLKEIEPEVKKIKDKHKDDKQEQAKKVMELYKRHGVNPFSGCFLLLVQFPVIIALYWVFWKGLTNGIDASILYSFVNAPETINFRFLGFIDMTEKSVILAFLAGITQYFQMKYSVISFGSDAGSGEKPKDGKISFKDEFARSFRLQMKYGLPFIVFFISYTISAAVALYWTASNVFSIIHELIVRRTAKQIKGEADNMDPVRSRDRGQNKGSS